MHLKKLLEDQLPFQWSTLYKINFSSLFKKDILWSKAKHFLGMCMSCQKTFRQISAFELKYYIRSWHLNSSVANWKNLKCNSLVRKNHDINKRDLLDNRKHCHLIRKQIDFSMTCLIIIAGLNNARTGSFHATLSNLNGFNGSDEVKITVTASPPKTFLG